MKDNPLEKDIESKVCAYARSRGAEAYKFTSPARAAVPDRLFVAPIGIIWFCEFKRMGEKPTSAQEREIVRLQLLGQRVYVIDNVKDGVRMVDREMDR
jgi:hypothetical protein